MKMVGIARLIGGRHLRDLAGAHLFKSGKSAGRRNEVFTAARAALPESALGFNTPQPLAD